MAAGVDGNLRDISAEEMFNMFFGNGVRFQSRPSQSQIPRSDIPESDIPRSEIPRSHVPREPIYPWGITHSMDFLFSPKLRPLDRISRTALCLFVLIGTLSVLAPLGAAYNAYKLAQHSVQLLKDDSLRENPRELQKLKAYALAFFVDLCACIGPVCLGLLAFRGPMSAILVGLIPITMGVDTMLEGIHGPQAPPVHTLRGGKDIRRWFEECLFEQNSEQSQSVKAPSKSPWDEEIEKAIQDLPKIRVPHSNADYENFRNNILLKKKPHELLGSSPIEIQQNHKKLKLIIHPDKNLDRKTEAEILFKCLSQAKEAIDPK